MSPNLCFYANLCFLWHSMICRHITFIFHLFQKHTCNYEKQPVVCCYYTNVEMGKQLCAMPVLLSCILQQANNCMRFTWANTENILILHIQISFFEQRVWDKYNQQNFHPCSSLPDLHSKTPPSRCLPLSLLLWHNDTEQQRHKIDTYQWALKWEWLKSVLASVQYCILYCHNKIIR